MPKNSPPHSAIPQLLLRVHEVVLVDCRVDVPLVRQVIYGLLNAVGGVPLGRYLVDNVVHVRSGIVTGCDNVATLQNE